MSNSEPITHASELGEFAYCRSAWWLGRAQGLPSTNRAALARGRTQHERHGRRARRAVTLQGVAAWGGGLALLLIAIGVCLLSNATGGYP